MKGTFLYEDWGMLNEFHRSLHFSFSMVAVPFYGAGVPTIVVGNVGTQVWAIFHDASHADLSVPPYKIQYPGLHARTCMYHNATTMNTKTCMFLKP